MLVPACSDLLAMIFSVVSRASPSYEKNLFFYVGGLACETIDLVWVTVIDGLEGHV